MNRNSTIISQYLIGKEEIQVFVEKRFEPKFPNLDQIYNSDPVYTLF